MKNFDDFLNTISEDEWSGIFEEASEPLKENGNIPLPMVPALSMRLSVQLLRRYHNWVYEDLEPASQNLED